MNAARTALPALPALALSLAVALAPPARAQMEDGAFIDQAMRALGFVCLLASPDQIDDAGRLLGLSPVTDQAVLHRQFRGTAGRMWTWMLTGRVAQLLRVEQGGACVLQVQGVNVLDVETGFGRLLRALPDSMELREQAVLREFPRPPLRARVTLVTRDAAPAVMELHAITDPRAPPGGYVLLRPGAP